MSTIVFTTPEQINFFQLATRRTALKLEIAGLKQRGGSVLNLCKLAYGLKGNKHQVLEQMEALVKKELGQA